MQLHTISICCRILQEICAWQNFTVQHKPLEYSKDRPNENEEDLNTTYNIGTLNVTPTLGCGVSKVFNKQRKITTRFFLYINVVMFTDQF